MERVIIVYSIFYSVKYQSITNLSAASVIAANWVKASFNGSLDESDIEQSCVIVDEIEHGQPLEERRVVVSDGLVILIRSHPLSNHLWR